MPSNKDRSSYYYRLYEQRVELVALRMVADAAQVCRDVVSPVYSHDADYIYVPDAEWRMLSNTLDELRKIK